MAAEIHNRRLKRLFRRLSGVADAVLLQGDPQLLRWLTGTPEGMAVATKKGVAMIAHRHPTAVATIIGLPICRLREYPIPKPQRNASTATIHLCQR